ncbi:MAG TPA: ParB/RepB/Spo0J family partition protein [Caldilineaceae bacterium]|nr:ParB/RepB/Spo0J family partition protein [Caldilineaceae bacterium]
MSTLLQRAAQAARNGTDADVSRETLARVPIVSVVDNPWQNRTHYGDLDELAADIERNGLLQPPIARLSPDGSGGYQIAFGHRRLRACQLAGLSSFPLFVHNLTDEEMAEYAWSENEKRSDTSAIEKARHIQRVQTDFGWTQEQVAQRFGINRSTAANLLRLLELPDAVQAQVDSGALPARSGMLLLRLTDAPEALAAVAEAAATAGQTTREVEAAIAEHRQRIDAEREKARQIAAVDALGLGVAWIEERTHNVSTFRPGSTWADSRLLEAGICGPGLCDCLRLWHKGERTWLQGDEAGPLPGDAPHIFWCCSQDNQCKNKREEWLAAQSQGHDQQAAQAQREEKERIAAAERARRKAVAESMLDSIVQRFPADEYWTDLRFWRFVADKANYSIAGCLKDALHLADAYRRLLEAALIEKGWIKDFGHTIDLNATQKNRSRLYSALDAKPATQPQPGDSQNTGWQDGWDDEDQTEFISMPSLPRPEQITRPRVALRIIENLPKGGKGDRAPFWLRYNEIIDLSEETNK